VAPKGLTILIFWFLKSGKNPLFLGVLAIFLFFKKMSFLENCPLFALFLLLLFYF